jgi:cardiolipin synthase
MPPSSPHYGSGESQSVVHVRWLFLMLGFPVGGLVIYTLFGRGWKALSRKNQPHTLIEHTALVERQAVMVERQPGWLDELVRTGVGDYARLGHMLWLSASAPLTLTNRFEILQDAREKYPRLMADLRAASQSIHLVYFEWASDPFADEVADLLAAKVASGVAVRILYDPVGSL